MRLKNVQSIIRTFKGAEGYSESIQWAKLIDTWEILIKIQLIHNARSPICRLDMWDATLGNGNILYCKICETNWQHEIWLISSPSPFPKLYKQIGQSSLWRERKEEARVNRAFVLNISSSKETMIVSLEVNYKFTLW